MKVATVGLFVVVIVGAAGACQWLLPERFAVNAPIGQMLWGAGIDAPDSGTISDRMRAPEGFEISLWAEGTRGARVLRPTPTGDLLVGSPVQNSILLLEADADGDGRSDGQRVLLEELNHPYGVELRDGWLYVGETGGIARVPFDPGKTATPGKPSGARITGELEYIVNDLPPGGNHWTRNLRFGPDGWLYVNVGSSCNVCLEDDPNRRAALLRFRSDGSGEETFATGLRNSVGFAWQPSTGKFYATDNGRDLLGDNFPPCELNELVEGGFYGFPVANGNRMPDPDFGEGQEERIASSIPPAHGFRAHNAPLGINFIEGESLPKDYRGAALVALHGSWNRTQKDGYKVVSLHWDADGSIREEDFLTGFLRDEELIGRPADVVQGPDGAIYVSDDYAGVIWKVEYTGDL
ncbi:MAG: PQQ-dependent sugar dehydrogenase [Myxococcota bacterium]|nr:PQQ-dependent sugar dehydrogenase [Myxococcota bacterium]